MVYTFQHATLCTLMEFVSNSCALFACTQLPGLAGREAERVLERTDTVASAARSRRDHYMELENGVGLRGL